MSFIFVGLGLMAFLAATTLAIDVGMFMTARSQAQNSADAGALAGAVALVFDSYTDHSPSGPAVQSALGAARDNQVMRADVSVIPEDVTFLPDPTGEVNRVRVAVHRTAARSNPIATLMGRFFGVAFADVMATAVAEASPANAATCIKPWAIPDKWIEIQTPPWDPDADTFDLYFNNGNPRPDQDVYKPITEADYTGYRSDAAGPDYARQVTLKPGNPHQAINPSHFFPIALPPGTGADWYEENIGDCWPGILQIGDTIPVEPGNMEGPTASGTDRLIGRDRPAYWDTGRSRVTSTFNPSPRIVVLPVFDPIVYEESRQHGRQEIKVANLVGFFIEDFRAGDVIARVVPTTGLLRGNGTAPNGAYLRVIRLVQ